MFELCLLPVLPSVRPLRHLLANSKSILSPLRVALIWVRPRSLHRAGCEDGRAGQRQDPLLPFFFYRWEYHLYPLFSVNVGLGAPPGFSNNNTLKSISPNQAGSATSW